MSTEGQKEKRLHKGGVGPKMRSPAGLSPKNTTGAGSSSTAPLLTEGGSA